MKTPKKLFVFSAIKESDSKSISTPNFSTTSTGTPLKTSMTNTPSNTPLSTATYSRIMTPSATPQSAKKVPLEKTPTARKVSTPAGTPKSNTVKYSMSKTPTLTPQSNVKKSFLANTPLVTPLSTKHRAMRSTPTAKPQSGGQNPIIRKRSRPTDDVTPGSSKKVRLATRLNNVAEILALEDQESRTVVVTNVHFKATKEELWKHFMPCGNIFDITMLNHLTNGLPTGVAYIEFANQGAAKKALGFNGSSFLYRDLQVLPRSESGDIRVIPRDPNHPGRKLLNKCWARRGVNVITRGDIFKLKLKCEALEKEVNGYFKSFPQRSLGGSHYEGFSKCSTISI